MADDLLYPRFALGPVRTALADTPIVVVQGARQVGKSTLVGMVAGERDSRVITLDDPSTLELADDDPVTVADFYPTGLLAIDEAQRAPGLILPLKANVDVHRAPGRFLLTGSADLLHVKGAGDSLAGRAETVEMMPLSQGELSRRETPEDFVTWILSGAQTRETFPVLDPATVIRGGYPAVVDRTPARSAAWFRSYIARLSDHDARELHGGGYSDQLSALLTYLASLGQTELVKAHVSRHLSVAESTVDSYLRLAKTMRLVCELPPWNRAPHKRVIRRPKVCLNDTGLSAALAGFTV
ncbi:MAG: AAA family ATPase [Propionibacteriaceae bacterium]|jgi:predicted AAA+ superfamily ATPase|nr:AAA family ATPase [Propionibacteriaceae bacterium]